MHSAHASLTPRSVVAGFDPTVLLHQLRRRDLFRFSISSNNTSVSLRILVCLLPPLLDGVAPEPRVRAFNLRNISLAACLLACLSAAQVVDQDQLIAAAREEIRRAKRREKMPE